MKKLSLLALGLFFSLSSIAATNIAVGPTNEVRIISPSGVTNVWWYLMTNALAGGSNCTVSVQGGKVTIDVGTNAFAFTLDPTQFTNNSLLSGLTATNFKSIFTSGSNYNIRLADVYTIMADGNIRYTLRAYNTNGLNNLFTISTLPPTFSIGNTAFYLNGMAADNLVYTDGSNVLRSVGVSPTEALQLSGVSENIQQGLNNRLKYATNVGSGARLVRTNEDGIAKVRTLIGLSGTSVSESGDHVYIAGGGGGGGYATNMAATNVLGPFVELHMTNHIDLPVEFSADTNGFVFVNDSTLVRIQSGSVDMDTYQGFSFNIIDSGIFSFNNGPIVGNGSGLTDISGTNSIIPKTITTNLLTDDAYNALIGGGSGGTVTNYPMADLKHDFGAVGDGITDDTAAVQLAAYWLSTNHGTLWVPWVSRWYRLTDTIRFTGSGWQILGAGAMTPDQAIKMGVTNRLGSIFYLEKQNADCFAITNSFTDTIKIANIGLCGMTNTTGRGIYIAPTAAGGGRVWLEDLQISEFGTQVYVRGGIQRAKNVYTFSSWSATNSPRVSFDVAGIGGINNDGVEFVGCNYIAGTFAILSGGRYTFNQCIGESDTNAFSCGGDRPVLQLRMIGNHVEHHGFTPVIISTNNGLAMLTVEDTSVTPYPATNQCYFLEKWGTPADGATHIAVVNSEIQTSSNGVHILTTQTANENVTSRGGSTVGLTVMATNGTKYVTGPIRVNTVASGSVAGTNVNADLYVESSGGVSHLYIDVMTNSGYINKLDLMQYQHDVKKDGILRFGSGTTLTGTSSNLSGIFTGTFVNPNAIFSGDAATATILNLSRDSAPAYASSIGAIGLHDSFWAQGQTYYGGTMYLNANSTSGQRLHMNRSGNGELEYYADTGSLGGTIASPTVRLALYPNASFVYNRLNSTNSGTGNYTSLTNGFLLLNSEIQGDGIGHDPAYFNGVMFPQGNFMSQNNAGYEAVKFNANLSYKSSGAGWYASAGAPGYQFEIQVGSSGPGEGVSFYRAAAASKMSSYPLWRLDSVGNNQLAGNLVMTNATKVLLGNTSATNIIISGLDGSITTTNSTTGNKVVTINTSGTEMSSNAVNAAWVLTDTNGIYGSNSVGQFRLTSAEIVITNALTGNKVAITFDGVLVSNAINAAWTLRNTNGTIGSNSAGYYAITNGSALLTGTLTSTGGVATYIGNRAALITSNTPTSGNWAWTNTLGVNCVVMVQGGNSTTAGGAIGVGWTPVATVLTNAVQTFIIQPNEWIGITGLTATATSVKIKRL